MATTRRLKGLDPTHAVIEMHLVDLDESLNLSRRLNENMIKVIAQDVYDTGYVLSFEELTRFFKELRTGRHGSIYQGINSEVICRALNNFIQSRASFFQQKSEGESNSWKVRREKDEVEDLTREELQERFNAMFNIPKEK